jgi:hypothetical protein
MDHVIQLNIQVLPQEIQTLLLEDTMQQLVEATQTHLHQLEYIIHLILEEMQITITVMLGILEIVIHKTVQFQILLLLCQETTVGHGEETPFQETVYPGTHKTLCVLALDGVPVIEQEIDFVEPQVLHLTTHEAETIKNLIQATSMHLLETHHITFLLEIIQLHQLVYGVLVLEAFVLEATTVQHIPVLLGAVSPLTILVATVKPVFHHISES